MLQDHQAPLPPKTPYSFPQSWRGKHQPHSSGGPLSSQEGEVWKKCFDSGAEKESFVHSHPREQNSEVAREISQSSKSRWDRGSKQTHRVCGRAPIHIWCLHSLEYLEGKFCKECTNTEFKEVGIRNSYLVKESSWSKKSKHCRFHKSYVHNTNDCINLKNAIEGLIKRGRLVKYIRDTKETKKAHQKRNVPQRKQSPKKTVQVVAMVKGKDTNNEIEEGHKRKHQYIASIPGGIPRLRNISKGTMMGKIAELMAINKNEGGTSIGVPGRSILGFWDNEKVREIPNKIFPLVNTTQLGRAVSHIPKAASRSLQAWGVR